MHSTTVKPIILAITLLIIVSLACSSTTTSTVQTQPLTTSGQGQSEPTGPPKPTNEPRSTNTPKPTPIPPTPTNIPIGLSRAYPYPAKETVSTPHWDIQVLETKRGEDAWKEIKAANMFNEPAPEGMEYLLVKLHVKSKYTDSDEHSISGCDFDVTGDRLIRYTCGMASAVEPEPKLIAK